MILENYSLISKAFSFSSLLEDVGVSWQLLSAHGHKVGTLERWSFALWFFMGQGCIIRRRKGKGIKSHMKKTIIIIAITSYLSLFLWGCAESQLELKRQETYKIVSESARETFDKVLVAKMEFLDCVRDYAIKNKQTSVTATELADAAISHCESSLSSYDLLNGSYHRRMYSLDALSGRIPTDNILQWIWDKAKEKARIESQELKESGKRLVIKTLVELRR